MDFFNISLMSLAGQEPACRDGGHASWVGRANPTYKEWESMCHLFYNLLDT